jgi:hypothetical protein
MKSRYSFMDPGAIMGVVVSLIILGVGVFAFWVTVQQTNSASGVVTPSATSSLQQNDTYYTWLGLKNGTDGSGNSVFNIVGIVLIIGAIMSIVGLVYQYVR